MKTKFKKTLATLLCCALLFCGNVFATDVADDYYHNHKNVEKSSTTVLTHCPNCMSALDVTYSAFYIKYSCGKCGFKAKVERDY